MAKTSNLQLAFKRIKQAYRTKKRRKAQLSLNYYVGLEYEYKKSIEDFKTKQTEKFNRYFNEDTLEIKARLNGIHHHIEIKENLMKKYDEKAYWMRRRFKTKHKNNPALDTLLNDYDETAKSNKTAYLSALDQKYNQSTYSADEQSKFSQVLEKHKLKLAQSLSALEVKVQKLNQKADLKIKKLILKQDKTKATIKTLNEHIQSFNAQQALLDEAALEAIISQLSDSGLSDKKKTKLEEKKNNLENKLMIQKDETIQLSVSNLKMFFGGIKAVNDLSFEVKKGEIFGLIGPNGAGKTTVFNCITQFYKPTGGSIYFRNKENHVVDLNTLSSHDMIHEGIARSFQNVELIWELTVLDNLLVSAHSLLLTDYLEHMVHTSKMKREENVIRTKGYQILKDLGIEAFAFRSPYGLPYGVLKKVELARTLMTDPSLIILDEPAAGLNEAETEDLAQIIKDINQKHGITIFLVEHDMGLVMSICERVCAISFGRRLALDSPKGIQDNIDVRVAYLGEDDHE